MSNEEIWTQKVEGELKELERIQKDTASIHPDFQSTLDALKMWLKEDAQRLFYPGMPEGEEPLLIAPVGQEYMPRLEKAIKIMQNLLPYLHDAPMSTTRLHTMLESHRVTIKSLNGELDTMTGSCLAFSKLDDWQDARDELLAELRKEVSQDA